MKILIILFLLITVLCYGADNFTDNYNLVVPEEASRDWTAKISNDIISIDTIMNMLSQDVSLLEVNPAGTVHIQGRLSVDSGITVSAETTTVGGGEVGRLAIISSDGTTTCYIKIWSGS